MSNNSLFELYSKFPVAIQNIACSIAGMKMRRVRYNRDFHDAFDFLKKSQWLSLSDQKTYQDEQLQFIIKHAYDTVPYYREVFDSKKLTPRDFKGVSDLWKLPILDKKTIRKRFKDLQSKSWPKKRFVYGHTGGTTGTSLQLVSDIETQPWQWAVWWRHRDRFDLKLNDPFIVFAGRDVVPLKNMNPPFWRRNIPMHQTYISVHHLTENNLPITADYLCSRKVVYYSGYPSAIYLVARYFLEKSISLPHPPRLVVTGAETLLPHQRYVIEKAFDTEIADQYGASEQCGNISECEKHTYHVDMEFGNIEFLEMEGMPSDVRRIVCTGFKNMAMPLIRYEIGDIATVSDAICPCGRKSPTVKKIDGRIESYVITPDGRYLGRLDFLFKDSKNIEEAQLVQEDISSITVRIVKSTKYNINDEKLLIKDLRKYLGDEIIIHLDYIDSIPRETNGKFRQIISYVFRDKYSRV
jgi:phenylacetate-CoA ligase